MQGVAVAHRLAPSSLVSKVAKKLNSHGLVAP
jgi:hypothetical protein